MTVGKAAFRSWRNPPERFGIELGSLFHRDRVREDVKS